MNRCTGESIYCCLTHTYKWSELCFHNYLSCRLSIRTFGWVVQCESAVEEVLFSCFSGITTLISEVLTCINACRWRLGVLMQWLVGLGGLTGFWWATSCGVCLTTPRTLQEKGKSVVPFRCMLCSDKFWSVHIWPLATATPSPYHLHPVLWRIFSILLGSMVVLHSVHVGINCPLYFCSCVYKCVCKQFSERLYGDLLNEITCHLQRLSQQLQVRCPCLLHFMTLNRLHNVTSVIYSFNEQNIHNSCIKLFWP